MTRDDTPLETVDLGVGNGLRLSGDHGARCAARDHHDIGRDRCRSEHEQLLNKAGFRLERAIQTRSDVTILEAVAAH